MRCPTLWVISLSAVLLALVACAEKPAQAPGQKSGSGASSAEAASIGTTVPSIVELSDMYVSPEIYDLRMTVAEVIRGEKSMEVLNKLGSSMVQPNADSEFVLARIRMEYKARGAPGDKPWELSGGQFSAFSDDKKPYASPTIVALPSGLKPSLRSGDTLECWLAFTVAKGDRKPIMTFSPGGIWFHLY